MNALTELKHGLEGVWESLSEGWNHIRERAASALTRFRPSAKSDVSVRSNEGPFAFIAPTWALLAGDVFEDERRVVVRLEVPGLEARDLDLEVRDDVLVVRGEKRFEHEESEGRYRLLQRAYGRFQRTVPLPAPVQADKAKAAYRNGVLKVELPKARDRAASCDPDRRPLGSGVRGAGSSDSDSQTNGISSCAIFRVNARSAEHELTGARMTRETALSKPLAEPSGSTIEM